MSRRPISRPRRTERKHATTCGRRAHRLTSSAIRQAPLGLSPAGCEFVDGGGESRAARSRSYTARVPSVPRETRDEACRAWRRAAASQNGPRQRRARVPSARLHELRAVRCAAADRDTPGEAGSGEAGSAPRRRPAHRESGSRLKQCANRAHVFTEAGNRYRLAQPPEHHHPVCRAGCEVRALHAAAATNWEQSSHARCMSRAHRENRVPGQPKPRHAAVQVAEQAVWKPLTGKKQARTRR